MLVVEYDGTRYHGFQLQATDVPTIQAELEQALTKVTRRATRVAGAGRTDRGVHAAGQVVSFRTSSGLALDTLRRALNAELPKDIAVLAAGEVAADFHARFSARGREYRYTILNRPVRSPISRRYEHHVAAPLDTEAMADAALALVGKHDFAAFAGAVEGDGGSVREIRAIAVSRSGERVYIDIVADSFLPHMVRIVVGTLLRVGRGLLARADVAAILESKERRTAGFSAPARGLCLTRVDY